MAVRKPSHYSLEEAQWILLSPFKGLTFIYLFLYHYFTLRSYSQKWDFF